MLALGLIQLQFTLLSSELIKAKIDRLAADFL